MHKPLINRHAHAAGARPSDYRFYVTCSCREGSPLQLTKQQAEDWKMAHLRNVELALANAHRGKGTLATEMNHARSMLDDPNVSQSDKVTWQIVYDGARKRLGLPAPGEPEPPKPEALW